MSKYIVSTTINAVTEAILKYDSFDDWKLVVAGDLKTPKDYKLKNGVYLDPRSQEKLDEDLSNLIGWNCIQRRNLALLYAVRAGATEIALIDDDNIPLENWGKSLLVGKTLEVNTFQCDQLAFDPIGAAGEQSLWHRGFPLELLKLRDYSNYKKEFLKPSVQANFWNGDPDIDAICRLEHQPNVLFNSGKFPFASNALSPFNSQNTIISREIVGDYFLFPFIGRMDDIWASYYVESKGYKVVYHEATVFQSRNEHNLIEDMKKEYIGYENNLSMIRDLIHDPESIIKYLPGRSIAAWNRFRKILT
jgi:hypothetical protein